MTIDHTRDQSSREEVYIVRIGDAEVSNMRMNIDLLVMERVAKAVAEQYLA